MEVHHHSHTSDPDSHRGRKKWTHYFWEFLMLFLAVFCGFLAEYQLEHMIENSREKVYIRSMREDLQQDTMEINRAISVIKGYDENCDTLLNMLEQPVNTERGYLKKLYELEYSLGAELATLSQRTLAQLKNAGGLRLIRDKKVADTITLYDSKSQYLAAIFKSYDEVSTIVFNKSIAIFDNQYIRHNFQSDTIKLLTVERDVIRHFANSLYTYQMVGRYYITSLLQHKKLATDLMELINKKYHLK